MGRLNTHPPLHVFSVYVFWFFLSCFFSSSFLTKHYGEVWLLAITTHPNMITYGCFLDMGARAAMHVIQKHRKEKIHSHCCRAPQDKREAKIVADEMGYLLRSTCCGLRVLLGSLWWRGDTHVGATGRWEALGPVEVGLPRGCGPQCHSASALM